MKHQETSIRPKRVLVVVGFPVGGIRTFMRYTYSNIDSRKYRFDIVAGASLESDALRKDAEKIKAAKLILHETPWGTPLLIKPLLNVLHNNRYDLIHSHGIAAAVNTSTVTYFSHIPHMVTVHGLLQDEDIGGDGIICRITETLISTLLGKVNVIHHVSEDMKVEYGRRFRWMGTSQCRIVVIPNGIEPCSFAKTRRDMSSDLRSSLGISEDCFLMGYIGRLNERRKGFDILVDAVERIETKKLIEGHYMLVTLGGGGRKKDYMRQICEKGLSERIKLMPFVYNVAKVLAEMDIVVMPSLWEACGLVPMEVLCSGVPLIATRCMGLREVIKGTPTISIPPNDVNAMVNAIVNASKSLPRDDFEKYRAEAVKRFDVKLAARRIESLYDDLTMRNA